MCPDLTEETPSGSILVKDHLPKQPLSFWVVAYGRFEFNDNTQTDNASDT